MSDVRGIIRRCIEVIAIVGAVNAVIQSGFIVEQVAAHTPAVTGAPQRGDGLSSATIFALEWREHLSTVGLIVGGLVLAAAVAAFAITKNEDSRLQAVLVITSMGFASALVLWGGVGILLVLLPALAGT